MGFHQIQIWGNTIPGGTEVTKQLLLTAHWGQWPPSKILGSYRELKLTKTSHCVVQTKHRNFSAEMMGQRKSHFWKQWSHHTALVNGCQCPWHFPAPSPLLEAARGVWDAPHAGISKQPRFHHWILAAPSWTFHGFAKPLWLHKWKVQRLFANLSLQLASQQEENSGDAGHLQTRCCSCYSQVAHLYSLLFNLYPEL